ncbi:thioesterase family protein [Spirillospora sp. NBC_00431]
MGSLRIARYRAEHVDTDAGGVVHFTRYASWLESAVLEGLEDLGLGVGGLGERGLVPAVTELTMKYVRSARFLDRIEVRARVDHVGGASVRFAGEVRLSDGALLAAGTLVWCLVDDTAGAAVRLPASFRANLRDSMEESAR